MARTENSKVWEHIIRLTALLLTLVFCVVATIYCHTHHYVYEGQWQGALRQSILCRVGLIPSTGGDECSPSSRPSLSIYNLQVLAWCLPTIVIASFCWTSNTSYIWRACVARVVGVNPHQLQKENTYNGPSNQNKMMIQPIPNNHEQFALENYNRPNNTVMTAPDNGAVVVRNYNLHNNFDGNDVSSMMGGMSRALPYHDRGVRDDSQLMMMGGADSNDHHHQFIGGHNTDSEQSVTTRYSVESGLQFFSSKRQQMKGRARRHSLDSQLSFHVSDVEREAARHTMVRFGGSQQRASVTSYNSRTSRLSRTDWLGRKMSAKRGYDSRRASFTSEESSFSSVLVTRTTGVAEDTLFSNMMRRLNLSSSAGSTPLPTVEGNSGGATIYQNTGTIVDLSSNPYSHGTKNRCATIGVQTSLEADDLQPFAPVTFDKSVQVTPPRITSGSKNSQNIITPTLLRANKNTLISSNKTSTQKTDDISTSSDEKQESTPFKRSKRTGGLSTKDRKVLENNLRNSRDETLNQISNVDEKNNYEQPKPNKKEKSSRNKQKSDRQVHRKKKKKHSTHGALSNNQENSLLSPISRNGSTDYLINRTGTPRVSSAGGDGLEIGGRLSSAVGGSRGTFLDSGTISTILDNDVLSSNSN